jgi:hypothetical protein
MLVDILLLLLLLLAAEQRALGGEGAPTRTGLARRAPRQKNLSLSLSFSSSLSSFSLPFLHPPPTLSSSPSHPIPFSKKYSKKKLPKKTGKSKKTQFQTLFSDLPKDCVGAKFPLIARLSAPAPCDQVTSYRSSRSIPLSPVGVLFSFVCLPREVSLSSYKSLSSAVFRLRTF